MADPTVHRVRVSAGSLRGADPLFVVPHAWTDGGVAVEGAGTGAHLLHGAVAVCVLNDLYREAVQRGLALAGVAVGAHGGFDHDWASTGIVYDVEVDGLAEPALGDLLDRVDAVAEIPRAVRAGATVVRREVVSHG